MDNRLPYYKNLDGLRGVAALAVMVFHFFLTSELTRSLKDLELYKSITEFGQHGVTLFFVLSGFVISRILFNKKGKEGYFGDFYKRRALRIFPLYYLYLIVFFYVFPYFIKGAPNTDFSKQLPVYLYLQNMRWLTCFDSIGPGHYWSLAVEEHFYLVWPLIVWLVPYRNMKGLIIVLIILGLPLKYYFVRNDIDINYNTFARFDQILLGSFLAVLERDNKFQVSKINFKTIFIALLGLFITGALVYKFQNLFPTVKTLFKYNILGLFFFFIIFLLIFTNRNHVFNKFLESKPLQYLGKISYGLYVWHMLALSITVYFGIQLTSINFLIALMITILLAHISYFYYESFFLKFK
jgi:peptidoglycan/LPS O-acetylase OafA/YrhL